MGPDSDSPWLKFIRTTEHLNSVKDAIAQDVSTYGKRYIAIADGKETIDVMEPSPIISMLAGELIYQLRSTLDHLAFSLVERNWSGIVLPPQWEEDCQFPIWIKPLPQGQTVPRPLGTFKKSLPGISMEVHTIVERVQPYYPVGAVNHSLRFLACLSNIDKHRRFALTRTRAQVRYDVIHKSGITGYSMETLEHGAEIPPPYEWENDPIVQVDRSTELKITFNERSTLGAATDVPIETLLENMVGEIFSGVIIPLRDLLK